MKNIKDFSYGYEQLVATLVSYCFLFFAKYFNKSLLWLSLEDNQTICIMNPVLKNILSVLAGLIVGSLVNMGIVMLSGSFIPPPEGGDVTTMEGLKASIHLFEPKHFLMPFLAHAFGTLVGAFVAAKIAVNRHMIMAVLVGTFFFIGGAINVFLLGGPLWFSALDLTVAYIPMSLLGWKLAGGK